MMKHTYTKGFTIVEILVVIVILAVLALLSVVGYNGIREKATENNALSDIQQAATVVEQYALANGGNFPDSTYLEEKLNISDGVNISLVTTNNAGEDEGEGGSWPVYSGLSEVQNSVLFFDVCNTIITEYRPDAPSLHYGQGINQGGQVTSYIQQAQACWVYGPAGTQVNTAWSPQQFNTPVTNNGMTNFINGLNYTDTWFPDRVHVEKQFYQAIHDRFLAQGGRYPITTFWNPSYGCNAWGCWNEPGKEELPVLPSTGGGGGVGGGSNSTPNEIAQSYCLIATHERYADILYSFSSDSLTPKNGNC